MSAENIDRKYLQVINHFALKLIDLKTTDELFWFLSKEIISQFDLEDCIVYSFDAKDSVLIQKAAFGPKNPKEQIIEHPIKIPLGKGIVGTAALQKKYVCVNDTSLDDRYIVDDVRRFSELAIPMIYGNELIGVIDSEHSEKYFYTEAHIQILQSIAAISATKFKNILYQKDLLSQNNKLEAKVDEQFYELKNLISKLKSSNSELENFASIISHDMQQPLNSILGFISLIEKKEPNLSDKSIEYFKIISESAYRLKSQIKTMLDYGSIANQNPLLEEVDLNEVLKAVQINLSELIDSSQSKISFKELPKVKGNFNLLIHLFQNIISNSIKYNRNKPKVDIDFQYEDVNLSIQINDNGIGIDEKYKDKIFNIFERGASTDKTEGSGIGLAICKKIMQHHNGFISFSSPNEEGTSFHLNFQLKEFLKV